MSVNQALMHVIVHVQISEVFMYFYSGHDESTVVALQVYIFVGEYASRRCMPCLSEFMDLETCDPLMGTYVCRCLDHLLKKIPAE